MRQRKYLLPVAHKSKQFGKELNTMADETEKGSWHLDPDEIDPDNMNREIPKEL